MMVQKGQYFEKLNASVSFGFVRTYTTLAHVFKKAVWNSLVPPARVKASPQPNPHVGAKVCADPRRGLKTGLSYFANIACHDLNQRTVALSDTND